MYFAQLIQENGYQDEDFIIDLAAKYAAKKGWKTIYADVDDMDGDFVSVFNSHQYFVESNINGYFGKFLCMTDEVKK